MRQVQGFHLGDVLRTAFLVYGRNLPAFCLLTLIAFVPLFVLMGAYPEIFEQLNMPPPPDATADAAARRAFLAEFSANFEPAMRALGLYLGIYTLCGCWMQAGLTYAVVRTLRATAPGFRDLLWQSCRAFPRVLLATVLMYMCISFGMLLLIVPGIIVSLMLWVVVPVAVVERRSGSALPRSATLTKGYKLHLLGLWLLVVLFGLIVTMVPGAIVSDFAPQLSQIVEGVLGALVTSVTAVVAAVAYHDLRVTKEGAGASVAKVFE